MSESTVVIRVDEELKLLSPARQRPPIARLRNCCEISCASLSASAAGRVRPVVEGKVEVSRKALREGKFADDEEVAAYFAERRAKSTQ